MDFGILGTRKWTQKLNSNLEASYPIPGLVASGHTVVHLTGSVYLGSELAREFPDSSLYKGLVILLNFYNARR